MKTSIPARTSMVVDTTPISRAGFQGLAFKMTREDEKERHDEIDRELYCLEHGIQPDGQRPSDKTIEALRQAAKERGASERQAELGVDELVAVFRRVELRSGRALGGLARVCRMWRAAATFLR